MRHLCFSYHTCPLEEPGTELAGGMNVYLRGLLPALQAETLVLTSGREFQELEMGPVRIWRIPCRGRLWDREQAYQALPRFLEECGARLNGLEFESLSAHYWMSGMAARALFPERSPVLMFHSLDPGRNPVRAEAEAELAQHCLVVFSSALDRAVSQPKLKGLKQARVIRPGCDPSFCLRSQIEARFRLGLPLEGPLAGLVARDDPAKNATLARTIAAQAGIPLIETPGPRWPDGLPHAEMPWFYAAMDVVLSLADYETFGLSVLEALATGCRALVAERGYWGAVGRRTGLVTVGTDLARALAAPPPDGELVRRYFNWERAASRWLEALRLGHP